MIRVGVSIGVSKNGAEPKKRRVRRRGDQGWSGAHDGRRRPGVQRRRAKSTGRARNPRPPEKVQALRSGRSPLHALRWSGAEGATGASPDAARWGADDRRGHLTSPDRRGAMLGPSPAAVGFGPARWSSAARRRCTRGRLTRRFAGSAPLLLTPMLTLARIVALVVAGQLSIT
jgi:hypothetical protein